MTELMRRRRALMGQKKENILYKLPEKVTNTSLMFFDSGFNLLQINSDWTVFASLKITNRDCFPIANAVSGNYDVVASPNSQIISDVYANGLFCISKGRFNAQYLTYASTKGEFNNFNSSTFPWTYTGSITLCVVHKKEQKTISFFLSYGGETYNKITNRYSEYPSGAEHNLSSYFQGTLLELIVFQVAKTDAECEEMLLGDRL